MFWINDFYNAGRHNDWIPSYHLREVDNSNRLTIEMPGVSRSDLKINVKDRYLTIEAKRNLGRGEQKWKGQWVISDRVNTEQIEARLESGILDVSFPATEKSKSREIEIM